MNRPRVLILAETANPEWVSVPLIGWSHARALAEVADTHIVTQIRNRDAFVRAGLTEGKDFTAIDSEALARPIWKTASFILGGKDKGWGIMTAITSISYAYFERLAWKRFGAQIRAGDFDVVHRITPVSPAVNSPIAKHCARAGIPFILGPINGGVPWPEGHNAARKGEREWLTPLRKLRKFIPGHRATRKNSAAILVASEWTLKGEPEWAHDKCIYLPENAIDPERFTKRRTRTASRPLRCVFVGRLVACKGIDLLIQAAAPMLKSGDMELKVIGDGPGMHNLCAIAEQEGVIDSVRFQGWVKHTELQDNLIEADLFTFPSIRDFGGGVVLEAMAVGLPSLVVAYGGPAELVTPTTGFTVPIAPPEELIQSLRNKLKELIKDPSEIDNRVEPALQRAGQLFTWSARVKQELDVYQWVMGQRTDKPDFGMPLPDLKLPEQDNARAPERTTTQA